MSTALAHEKPVYHHPKRPEWGMAIVTQDLPDLLCTAFENGRQAKFFKQNLPIVLVDLSDGDRNSLYARLKRSSPSATAGKRAPAKKIKVATVEATSFEQQLAIFTALFPAGFADADYVAQERAGEGKNKGHEATRLLAQDVLAKAKLEAALGEKRFGDVLAAAVQVLKAGHNMAHPQFEVAPLATLAAEQHEAFARALFALLYGAGDFATRFDAFVATLTPPFWTTATVFPALMSPSEHFFAKPKIEQRQARLLAVDEPPGGVPSHTGYVRYQTLGQALLARLTAAGQAPRDLLDAYAFVTITLGAKPMKKPKPVKAPKAPKAAKAEPEESASEEPEAD